MSEVEQLVAEARRVVGSIVRQGTHRLLADAEVSDVQRIVIEASRRLEDVEMYALLASDVNIDAKVAIELEIMRLRELEKSLGRDQGR